jgi:hypothetical protein
MLCKGIFAVPDIKVIKEKSSTDCQFQGTNRITGFTLSPRAISGSFPAYLILSLQSKSIINLISLVMCNAA